jgi:putative transcriptional regulator
MSFKELRELTGLSRAAFSREYHIPIRTIEDWESERRTPPQYVLELLEFKIRTIIVTDPSGTTLKSVGKPLADHGYKIQIFNLMDRSHSNKFNPFKYVKTKEEINILSVLQQKYGEEFTFKAWSWEKYGSNNKNAYVTCESMPGVEIEVYQRETDNGMTYYDDYMAYKYKSRFQEDLQRFTDQIYPNAKVIFMVDSSTFPLDMGMGMTYDEILQDKDTVLSVTILVKCDSDDPQKEEHLEEFRQLLEDNSVRVNGTLIYTSDETTWNEYSENNYSNWYANDDWYLSRCNFSLDKSYQFYKCIKTTW